MAHGKQMFWMEKSSRHNNRAKEYLLILRAILFKAMTTAVFFLVSLTWKWLSDILRNNSRVTTFCILQDIDTGLCHLLVNFLCTFLHVFWKWSSNCIVLDILKNNTLYFFLHLRIYFWGLSSNLFDMLSIFCGLIKKMA